MHYTWNCLNMDPRLFPLFHQMSTLHNNGVAKLISDKNTCENEYYYHKIHQILFRKKKNLQYVDHRLLSQYPSAGLDFVQNQVKLHELNLFLFEVLGVLFVKHSHTCLTHGAFHVPNELLYQQSGGYNNHKKWQVIWIVLQDIKYNAQSINFKNSLLNIFSCGKENTEVWITQKIGKERAHSYWKNDEISGRKAHTNTQYVRINLLLFSTVLSSNS